MRLTTALTTLIISTSAALATPNRLRSTTHRRATTRPENHRLSHVPPSSHRSTASFSAAADGGDQLPESVRGGAALAGKDVSTVVGTFEIPSAEMPTRGPTGGNVAGLYSASYWVGIDGAAECVGEASLRAGVDTFWDGGLRSYNAWYEWYPEPAADFANFTAAPGDVIRVTATAKGKGEGAVKVERLADGGKNATVVAEVSKSWSGQEEKSPLCLAEAAWVVEDFSLASMPGVPVALANFTAVTFKDVGATTADEEVLDLAGAQILNINLEPQGGLLTDCALEGDSGVRCKRVVDGI